MNGMLPALLLAVVAAVSLFWWYLRMRSNDHMNEAAGRHAAGARISSRARLVDGANHIPVALTLAADRIYYENPDLQADVEIASIDEVEYGSDLVTGQTSHGSVLRLRAHGRSIEFVMTEAAAGEWSRLLPAHSLGTPGTVHAS